MAWQGPDTFHMAWQGHDTLDMARQGHDTLNMAWQDTDTMRMTHGMAGPWTEPERDRIGFLTVNSTLFPSLRDVALFVHTRGDPPPSNPHCGLPWEHGQEE